jgi:hypothetical protein
MEMPSAPGKWVLTLVKGKPTVLSAFSNGKAIMIPWSSILYLEVVDIPEQPGMTRVYLLNDKQCLIQVALNDIYQAINYNTDFVSR